ncbi:MAG: LTA synthase family protein [Eubacteriales bacterium]|nr:LTA synthase family protein [Eubacteriales bacterium]MDD4582658.1 LTA synthase family protein [Eubacteriales bacterium]
MKVFYRKYLIYGGVQSALLAFLLNLLIEIISRRSLLGGLGFLAGNPKVFFYNTFIIFVSLSVSLLVKRRIFVYVLISSLWLALGIINGVILSFRMTPFTVSDLALLENGLSILPNYMSTFEIVLTVLAIIIAIALFVVAFLFAPKKKNPIRYKLNFVLIIVFMLALYGFTNLGVNNRWLSTYFSNLGYAYEDYGVPYCFINTWLNRGVPIPVDYSEELVLSVFKDGIPMGVDEANTSIPVIHTAGEETKNQPNIIFVQLESFIDPTLIEGLELSGDPIPNFHKLKKKYSNGYLKVPAVGAGTANTEFEVLSGMRIMSFGPGEYPYKTIMKDTTCESVNYVLKKWGYTTHAIHNHRGAFYGRNLVYANLGFDTFTSVEYMNKVKKTPRNWAKDRILTGEILAALESTEGQDFIFTVSVQGHGRYPENKLIDDEKLAVRVVGGIEDEKERNAMEYYIQQVYEMDQFVGDLISTFKKYDEKTVLVFYGDHLPVLSLTEEDLVNRSIYETQYIIYANYDLKKIDGDLTSYQLYSEVMERLGIHNGILTWYHQTRKNHGNYLDNLEILQYDMLYGSNYVYGGSNPFKPKELKMGVRPIWVEKIFNFGESTYVVGENFTPYSKVAVKGDFMDTVFVNSRILRVPKGVKSLNPKDFSISQVGKYNTILSTLKDVE